MNQKISLASTCAALAILATPAMVMAQPGAPSHDPNSVQAGDYKLESSHARVIFDVSHFGFSTWYGEFPRATGTAHLDPKTPSANMVMITIPTANISTSNTTLDGELKAADWLDAAKYPTITFKSTAVTFTGPGMANVTGDLTMHGMTHPVTLAVKFNAAGPNMMSKAFTVGFDATAKLRRTEFGVNKFAPMVGDDVSIMISAPFEKVG